MSRNRILIVLIVLTFAGLLAWRVWGPVNAPAGQPPMQNLRSGQLVRVQDVFNESAGGHRLLVLLAPT